MKTVTVSTKNKYDVLIGGKLLHTAGEELRKLRGDCLCAVVSDDNVFAIYGKTLVCSLESNGYQVKSFVFPHGEGSKNTETLVSIIGFLADSGLGRGDIVFAMGGGVVGDITGLAAALFMRGIDYVQVPTTLLAMTDSSIGGKTAVDLKNGKNLMGAFHAPVLVLCDTDTLSTLPYDYLCDGMAEVIKYGMIYDCELLRLIENADMPNNDIIARCAELKARCVEADEYDRGERIKLNFGHTVGHAIELLSGYTVSHGRAVACGMAVVTRACEKRGLCETGTYQRLSGLLDKYGLPKQCEYSADALAYAALSDKKKCRGGVTVVLPEKAGAVFTKTLGQDELEKLISEGLL